MDSALGTTDGAALLNAALRTTDGSALLDSALRTTDGAALHFEYGCVGLVVGGWWLRCEKSVDELVMNDVSVSGEAMKSHDCSGLYTRLAPC